MTEYQKMIKYKYMYIRVQLKKVTVLENYLGKVKQMADVAALAQERNQLM